MLEDPTFWDAFDRVADEFPARPCVITPSRTSNFREVRRRSLAVAHFLRSRGLGCHTPRQSLSNWESGQDHLALYLGNGEPYIESMLAALAARAVPVNVNYRYVAAELVSLLSSTGVNAIVYDVSFAETLGQTLLSLPPMKALIQVGGTEPALLGAVLYSEILDVESRYAGTALPESEPDDLLMICTGGTTGLPKGVLWRQGDLLAQIVGDRHLGTGKPLQTIDDLLVGARESELRALVAPPMMHLTGIGLALLLCMSGGTTVFPDPPMGLDPVKFWEAVERDRVEIAVVVGDAYGRPLLAELKRKSYDTSSLRIVMNGAAAMSAGTKQALGEALGGHVRITDAIGSSESGVLARAVRGGEARPGVFHPSPSTGVVSAEVDRFLDPSDGSVGWLAGYGRLPLGYLGDQAKTEATFPTIAGRRCTVPGDRAKWLEDGTIQMLGREATTINTGGEKVFSDEVERALASHPDVREALVVGRPSDRWGQEVVALIILEPDRAFDRDSILAEAERHLARYKLPKDFVTVSAIERTAVGKPNYSWARQVAAAAGHDRPQAILRTC